MLKEGKQAAGEGRGKPAADKRVKPARGVLGVLVGTFGAGLWIAGGIAGFVLGLLLGLLFVGDAIRDVAVSILGQRFAGIGWLFGVSCSASAGGGLGALAGKILLGLAGNLLRKK